jgi:hypothetical protein
MKRFAYSFLRTAATGIRTGVLWLILVVLTCTLCPHHDAHPSAYSVADGEYAILYETAQRDRGVQTWSDRVVQSAAFAALPLTLLGTGVER